MEPTNEPYAVAKIAAIKTRQRWNENRELIGQGLAKIAAAFCHSMPVSGSFSRSAINLAANAQTSLSSIFSALFVLLALLFFTPFLYHIPKPVLAAIIMMAVVGLVNFRTMITAWRVNKDDGLAALITFVATLIFAPNIQRGILTGVLLSMGLLMYRLMRPRIAVLGLHSDGTFRDALVHHLPPIHEKLRVIRFDGSILFVNVSYFEDALLTLEAEDKNISDILIKCNGINILDTSGVEMLANIVKRFRGKEITLTFTDVKKQVLDIMNRSGLTKIIDEKNIVTTDHTALENILKRIGAINAP